MISITFLQFDFLAEEMFKRWTFLLKIPKYTNHLNYETLKS